MLDIDKIAEIGEFPFYHPYKGITVKELICQIREFFSIENLDDIDHINLHPFHLDPERYAHILPDKYIYAFGLQRNGDTDITEGIMTFGPTTDQFLVKYDCYHRQLKSVPYQRLGETIEKFTVFNAVKRYFIALLETGNRKPRGRMSEYSIQIVEDFRRHQVLLGAIHDGFIVSLTHDQPITKALYLDQRQDSMFHKRCKAGLVSETQIKLIKLVLNLFVREVALRTIEVLDLVETSSEECAYGRHSIKQIIASSGKTIDRICSLLKFIADNRVESIETRIWRYVHEK
ncbi:hypothetical protein BJ508DRAFT_417951 [Ascobolus immersus RN42]|uniref:Uncharacterized protein n=1 Tax=Ascobolus immersus RN42 TaxID=1160509 RepID=A0A3N4HPN1_ASCIM|nr:hypothetical protein BJ508DRAFT_417951 [Ascobolus immersus RN42]